MLECVKYLDTTADQKKEKNHFFLKIFRDPLQSPIEWPELIQLPKYRGICIEMVAGSQAIGDYSHSDQEGLVFNYGLPCIWQTSPLGSLSETRRYTVLRKEL